MNQLQKIETQLNKAIASGERTVSFIDIADYIGLDKHNRARVLRESIKALKQHDYLVFLKKEENPLGGRPGKEALFTINGAMHFMLMSHTDVGYQLRQRCIDMMMQKSPSEPPADSSEMVEQLAKMDARLAAIEGTVGHVVERVTWLLGKTDSIRKALGLSVPKKVLPGQIKLW